MYLMLQQDTPDDYVVATGETHSVRRVCEIAFGHVGLNYEDHVTLNEKFMRPAEVDLLIGDPSKAEHVLGWQRRTSFEDLVTMVVDASIELLSGRPKGSSRSPSPRVATGRPATLQARSAPCPPPGSQPPPTE